MFQTVTTVGYGDIGVSTQGEYSMTMFMMFAGVIFYSYILMKLLDSVGRALEAATKVQTKLDLL